MTIDEYIEQRNEIQLQAEPYGDEFAQHIWVELGVANRHIKRVLCGQIGLAFVEREIEQCFVRVRKVLVDKKSPAVGCGS